MMRSRTFCCGWLVAAFAGCSSVELPTERHFGLELAAANPSSPPVVDVLRVLDLQPTGGVDRDYPVVAAGVTLARNEFDRWIAPVDRLVTDAVVIGLARRQVATLVKGAADPGREQWQLHGRILEFAAVRQEGGNFAQVTLELWLVAADHLAFRSEFHGREPIQGEGTAAAVSALSRALGQIVGALEERLRAVPPVVADPGRTGR